MKQLSCRFEMLLTPKQNQEWEALAKKRNLTKAELIRRTMTESTLKRQRTHNDWNIYQKLGELTEDLKERKKECFANPVQTINEVIRCLEEFRLQTILDDES